MAKDQIQKLAQYLKVRCLHLKKKLLKVDESICKMLLDLDISLMKSSFTVSNDAYNYWKSACNLRVAHTTKNLRWKSICKTRISLKFCCARIRNGNWITTDRKHKVSQNKITKVEHKLAISFIVRSFKTIRLFSIFFAW